MRRFRIQLKNSINLSVIILSLFLISISGLSVAVSVQPDQAQKAVQGWLERNQQPMGRSIGRLTGRMAEVETLTDDAGDALCYVHHLSPEGFVITSADDEIEPIIAFSASGYFDDSPDNPLAALLKKDMSGRLAAVAEQVVQPIQHRKKRIKWQLLAGDNLAAAGEEFAQIESTASVSEVWVDPFVPTLWNQDDVGGSPCYNYYTPNNYVTGCVSTAMAQLIRYHSFPTTGIGVNSFTITVNGVPQTAYTMGGNGSGGAYNWSLMPYDPQSGVTLSERQQIGRLCHDTGAAVEMSYTSSASSASLYDADQQLTDTFQYANSVYTQSISTNPGDQRLWSAMNTNLDAQMPVMLGIDGPAGGHAIVADGYGYNGQTLYHHLNMGWGGSDNAWYQLPLIDAYYTFNVIDDCVYNVYTSGSGEIISGRVTNLAGAPLANVTVRAYYGSTLSKQTTTDSRGVYALTNLTSNREYRIEASKSGETFLPQYVQVGSSTDWSTPGNRCGILFVSANAGPPTAFDVVVDVDSTAVADIQLQVLDDGQPDPNLMQYIITSLPQHGDLSEPNVGPIDVVPYTLQAADPNGVKYTPCPYFGGQDTFTYKANDGGNYPTGGDSNIATVTVNVSNQKTTDYHSESNSYSRGMLDTSDYAVRSQLIYLSSEMGSSKRLTELGIRVYTVPGRTLNNFTIRMRHTTLNVYTSLQQIYDDWTTVYQSNESLTSGWNWFVFNAPFDYNGADNLMINISFWNSGTASDGYYYIYNVGQNRNYVMFDTNNDAGNPLNWDYYSYWDTYSQNSYMPVMQFISVSPIDPLAGDFDATCDVKLPDLAIFSQAWQTTSADAEYNPDCDLTPSKGAVNLQDLVILSDQWFETYP